MRQHAFAQGSRESEQKRRCQGENYGHWIKVTKKAYGLKYRWPCGRFDLSREAWRWIGTLQWSFAQPQLGKRKAMQQSSSPRCSSILFLRVEGGLDCFGQIHGFSLAPIMEEKDARLFLDHMIMDCHDV